jgi:hypothetical protein
MTDIPPIPRHLSQCTCGRGYIFDSTLHFTSCPIYVWTNTDWDCFNQGLDYKYPIYGRSPVQPALPNMEEASGLCRCVNGPDNCKLHYPNGYPDHLEKIGAKKAQNSPIETTSDRTRSIHSLWHELSLGEKIAIIRNDKQIQANCFNMDSRCLDKSWVVNTEFQ